MSPSNSSGVFRESVRRLDTEHEKNEPEHRYTRLISMSRSAESESQLLERVTGALQDCMEASAAFLIVPDRVKAGEYLVFSSFRSDSSRLDQLQDMLKRSLSSGLDSFTGNVVDTLLEREAEPRLFVVSPSFEPMRIALLVLGPVGGETKENNSFLSAAEHILRLRLEFFRNKEELRIRREAIRLIGNTVSGLQKPVGQDIRIQKELGEICRLLGFRTGAVLSLLDESDFSFQIQYSWSSDAGVAVVPGVFLARAVDEFRTNGGKPVGCHSAQTGFCMFVPLETGSRITRILMLTGPFPSQDLPPSHYEIAELFGAVVSQVLETEAPVPRRLGETQWETLFHSIGDPLYAIDNNYTLKVVNAGMSTLTMTEGSAAGETCYRFLFQKNDICPWCPVPKSQETGEPHRVEVDLFSSGHWQIQCFPHVDGTGNRIGSVQVLRNMKVLKKMQEQLIESEKMASAGKLISGVAHEVRNPLFGISATVRALANEVRDQKDVQPFLDIIASETTRLNRLMEDLLSYSRPVRIDKNASDIIEIVSEVVESFRHVSKENQAEVTLLHPDPIPPVAVDRNKIKQVLINLFENSLQHSEGTVRIDVFLQYLSFADPPEIQLVVKDNGKGITAEDLPRVFDPFFTTRSKGTGLGLSIVRKVIHDHGGRIAIESHSGVGTTFRISIPAHTAVE